MKEKKVKLYCDVSKRAGFVKNVRGYSGFIERMIESFLDNFDNQEEALLAIIDIKDRKADVSVTIKKKKQ